MPISVSAILRYWSQGFWRVCLNNLPLDAIALSSFSLSTSQAIVHGYISGAQDFSGEVWIAPLIFEKKSPMQESQYWVPLWLPATCEQGLLYLRKKVTLPWIPARHLPQLHAFDDWLRFELAFNDWHDFFSACLGALNQFSEPLWREALQQEGFVEMDQSLWITQENLLSIDPLTTQNYVERLSSGALNPLLEEYATFEESIKDKTYYEVIQTPLGVLSQAHLESTLESHCATYQLTKKSNRDRLQRWSASEAQWKPVLEINEEDAYLFIEHANRFLPEQVAPYLAKVTKACFIGDVNDVSCPPLFSAFQEESILIENEFIEDEVVEQLHYKGMLVGAGNAFTLALTNQGLPTFSDNREWHVQNLEWHLLAVVGKSEGQGRYRHNRAEARVLINMLKAGKLPAGVIVTPFEGQKKILQAGLATEGIGCEVFTFEEMPYEQWPFAILSTTYTTLDRRPFMFDQGDSILYSLLARLTKGLWIVGDPAIFDSKMHSPSGKLAKILKVSYSNKECTMENT